MNALVLACLLCLSAVRACTVDRNYTALTPGELVSRLDNIVYGRVMEFTQSKSTDASFQVYCIIKGDTRILENITIQAVSPWSACSGTYVYWVNVTSNFEEAGALMILGIQATKTPGVYTFHEVNDLQSSAFSDNKESWTLMNRVVKSDKFTPINAIGGSGCPVDSVQKGEPVAGSQKENGGVQHGIDALTAAVGVVLFLCGHSLGLTVWV